MNTKDALVALAVDARKRAKYFERRAGREPGTMYAPKAHDPIVRAQHERTALAFLGAAAVIEQVANEGKWP